MGDKIRYEDPMLSSFQQRYINFGLLDQYRNQGLSQMCLDTWYFSESPAFRQLKLGTFSIKANEESADFFATQLAGFRLAFSDLLRCKDGMQILYKLQLSDVRTRIHKLDSGSQGNKQPEEIIRDAISELDQLIVGVGIRLDTRVALRDFDHFVHEEWLPQTGMLYISANRLRTTEFDATQLALPWWASLTLNVVSIFEEDNRRILGPIRSLWQELRKQFPAISVIPDEFDQDPIITLAESPIGTPETNVELFEINAPRLQSAMMHWEQFIRRQAV